MPTTRLTWSEWIATNPPSAAAWATQNELDAAIISGGGAVMPFLDAREFNVVGDGVADDTVALQAWLDAEPTRTHFLPSPADVYKITDTLRVPTVDGFHILGESKYATIIEQATDNTPILETFGYLQRGYLFENFRLRFATEQPPANTNAICLNFQGPNDSEGVLWSCIFRHLYMENCYMGVCQTNGTDPTKWMVSWASEFSSIEMKNVSGSMMDFYTRMGVPQGQPAMVFSNVHLQNFYSTYKGDVTEPAVVYIGEAHFDNLGVEDWRGPVMTVPTGNVTLTNLHVERHDFQSETLLLLNYGTYTVDNSWVTFADGSDGNHWIVRGGGAKVQIGPNHIDTSALGAGVNIALAGAYATGADQNYYDITPIGVSHTGAATWWTYYSWDETQHGLPTNKGTATWNPADTANGAQTSTTVTVDGAAIGDVVAVGFSQAVPAGVLLVGAVTAADTVTVTLMNHSGGNVNLDSGTLTARIWKSLY